MKNNLPIVLIKCKDKYKSVLEDYFNDFDGALVKFISTTKEIEQEKNLKEVSLLIIELINPERITGATTSKIVKTLNNNEVPILYLSDQPITRIKTESIASSRHFDVIQFPISKEIFINKVGLLLELYKLKKTDENQNSNLENQLSERTNQLTREITQHIEAKLLLQEKSSQIDERSYFLKIIVESIPIPLYIKNDKGIYLDCNHAFEKLINLRRDQILGKRIFDITTADIAGETHKNDLFVLQTGKSKVYEEDYRTEDGSVIYLLTHKSAFDNKFYNLKGIIGAVVDITKARRAEKLLKIQHTFDYVASLEKGIKSTLDNILNQIMELEWVDAGGIYLYDKIKEELEMECSSGLSKEFKKVIGRYGKGSSQMELVLKRKPVYENYINPSLLKDNKPVEDTLRFVAIIPMVNVENNQLIGCLNLSSRKHDKISEQEKRDVEFIVKNLVRLIMYAQSQEKIKELNNELKRKVWERTRNLQEINQRLSIEINYHRGTKEKLRDLQNNIPIGVYATTMDGRFVYLNQFVVELFGYGSIEEMLKVPVPNIYYRKSQRDTFVSTLKGEGFVKNVELECVKKDKTVFWGIIDVNTIYDDNGKIIQFEGIIRDITQRKEAELEAKKAHNEIVENNERLEKRIEKALQEQKNDHQYVVQKSKLESLGELAAGIAHEINQPLGIMALSFENLQMKINADKASPDYLSNKFNSIETNIKRIRQIIDHIRTFSRDQDSLSLEKVNINNVVNKALSLIGTQYRNHNINISINLEKDIGFTVGSNIQAEQMVLNLLSNAKYAVDDKAAYINETDYSKEIIIKSSCSEKQVSLTIFDNGCGIDDQYLPRIFDPFFTTKPEGFGTGLGLSLTYGIVKSMRGEITVNSKKNEFTKFEVLFPRFPEND